MAYSLNPSADSCYDGTFCRKYFDYRRITMRKSAFLLSLICLFATFLLVSCGGNSESEDGYVTACEALSKTSMGSTEYSAAEIDELEARFVKMALSGGFSRVNHFRSTSEYAYVIEFENPDDASVFFGKITGSNYDAKQLGDVVVYGKSDSIATIK